MRILLVEDDRSLSAALVEVLQKSGHVVDTAYDGSTAIAVHRMGESDMIILDLGLPDIDGLDVLKAIRAKTTIVPVIILTARDSLNDRIKGLDRGADDYLPKPFDVDELMARLRVIERRLGTADSALIQLGSVVFDTRHNSVEIDQTPLSLSRREIMILRALMENAGRILSKQQLETKLYEWDDEVSSNAIEVHVHNLRKKLPDKYIKTIRGVGYSISAKHQK